ncbi:MAG: putative toxin-antitoxin system toxin component, PIN family [Chloroflexi bacterium]|nr:putative toxin-antitoxin system toxin component, PIN family [Chloroflexota bacterium]
MLRVVFDTVVFVRCLINHQSWWGRLVFDHATEYELVLARELVVEIMAVLQRPALQRRFSSLAGRDPVRVLDILARAEYVELTDIPRVCRDPNDDKFLETARVAQAAYLVTEDADLLDLDTYQGVTIVTAAAFLHILEHGDAGTP